MAASFTATDSLSGFASGATPKRRLYFHQEGLNQVHTFTVSDLAGNSASATVSNVNIDKTPPIIGAVASPAPQRKRNHTMSPSASTPRTLSQALILRAVQ